MSPFCLCQLRPNVGRSACMALFTTVKRNSIASTLPLRPGPCLCISSSLCVRRPLFRASFDTMLISFPTESQRFDPRGKKRLHRLVLRDYARAPAPSRATYGRLSRSWPVEALGSLSFTSLCMCSCTKQSDLWSPVTSLAGGAG